MMYLFLRKFKKKFISFDAPYWLVYYFLLWTHLDRRASDKFWIKLRFRCEMHKKLNLKSPKTYIEKLQWLKLYDRNPQYTTLVDKIAVKEWVANKIGSKYVIPTIATYDNIEEIEWEKLPNQFVVKWNHDSGSIVICKDKIHFDIDAAKHKLLKGAKENGYWHAREWPYKNVKPRIIIEKYLEDSNKQFLLDNKFFCFNGIPKIMYLSSDLSENAHTDFFDMDFSHLPIRMKDPNSEIIPFKPQKFEEMKALARELCKGIPHVRTDFYLINNEIYFGEITFYHNAGFCEVNPSEWNLKIGEWITLPNNVMGGGKLLKINDIYIHCRLNGVIEYELQDYKFYCFNGIPKFMYVGSDRQSNGSVCIDFFDMDGNHLDIKQKGYPNSIFTPKLPLEFELMKIIATQLSQNIPHVRVDFYDVNGIVYFGEMTFFDGGGFVEFENEGSNRLVGSWIQLPQN